MQRLLNFYRWDAATICDDLRAWGQTNRFQGCQGSRPRTRQSRTLGVEKQMEHRQLHSRLGWGVRAFRAVPWGYNAYKAHRAHRASRAANCTRNSFTLDTGILMSDGNYKPIGEIEIGDKVLATDPDTSERRPEIVTDVIVGQGEKQLVGVNVDMDGAQASDEVIATDRHPFYVVGRGWIDAIALQKGDLLATSAGVGAVTSTRSWREVTTVRNLTVSRLHTYYVGVDAGAALVHNCINGWVGHALKRAQQRGISEDMVR